MDKNEIREEVYEALRGDCSCDYITKKEMMELLNDVDKWLETAKSGDKYYYNGNEYELTIEYKLAVWKNKEQRNAGEPTYITPISSSTDLEAIKYEAERYDIEASGCIEIFELDCDNAILHYENGVWTE